MFGFWFSDIELQPEYQPGNPEHEPKKTHTQTQTKNSERPEPAKTE